MGKPESILGSGAMGQEAGKMFVKLVQLGIRSSVKMGWTEKALFLGCTGSV